MASSRPETTPAPDDPRYAALVVRLDFTEKMNEQRFVAQEKAVSAALAAAERAVSKAEVAAEKRFEGVNEFRAVLTAQQATFISRHEFQQATDAMKEKIDLLSSGAASGAGRNIGTNAAWGWVIAVIGAVVGLVGLVAVLIQSGKP